jgi:ABC-2 type transport system permease protein
MSGQPIVPAVPAQPVPAEDVIHDIGFRHYDGVRFGRGWIVRSLLVDTLRGVFGLGRPARAKVMPWILVGILLAPPLVVALVAVLTGAHKLPISYTQYLSQLQLPIALFVAGAAPYAVSRDLRFGVMPLYLSRPMVRTDYVWARYGGVAIAMFLVTAGPQTLLLIGALLAKMPVGDQVSGWLGGLLASLLLSVLLAALGLVIAAFTPRRGLGVAAIITTLLVVSGISIALSGIAQSQKSHTWAVLAGVLDPNRLIDGLAAKVLDVAPAIPEFAPTTGGEVAVFALFYVVLVVGAGALLLRRYRKAGRL